MVNYKVKDSEHIADGQKKILSPSKSPSLPLFATAESVPVSKKMISKGKLTTCKESTRKRKSSKTSAADSTSNEKDLQPYWTEQCAEKSLHLWLPTKTDLQDSELILSDRFLKSTVENSWFSTRLHIAPKKNSSTTFVPLSTVFHAAYTDFEPIKIKSRKIRIYPNAEQRKLLKKWFAGARKAYNSAIAYLKQPGTKAIWKSIKTQLIQELPDWCKDVPYQIKSIAVRDACKAISKAKKDYKKTGKIQECKFRSVKNPQQTMFIPKSAITPQGVYHTLLNSLLASEPIHTDSDCRLTCENGQWYLIVGIKVEAPAISDNQAKVVAVDPGIRTFASFYSVDSCGKIGLQNFGRILSLGRHLDKLISRRATCKNKRSRYNMRKAERRIRWRIKNLIHEIHHKAAKFLLDNFDVIIIPPFETSQMSNKTKRKLHAKSVRAMMTFAHYRFQEFLKFKAKSCGKVVINQDEAYTSKTASWTGEIKTIGGAKYIKSGGRVVDRDFNGSRGIFLRGLCEISPALEQ